MFDVYRVYYAILNESFGNIIFIFSLYIFIGSIIVSLNLIKYAKSKTSPVQFCEANQQLLAQYSITPREQEVVLKVLSGESNSSIALSLNLKENTVKQHLNNIFKKCQVVNRWELMHLFQR